MPRDSLNEAVRTATAWLASGSSACNRFRRILDLLEPFRETRPKLLLFAGFPGLAAEVMSLLESTFGNDAVASFRSDQSMEAKESSALRFQQDSATWLLVSDESGGEGRNFQFAAEVIHIDTPWHVARVEQRIGRLDRLGRERFRDDVISRVVFNDASIEAGLIHIYDKALGVYQKSISGLEFALRDVERAISSHALTGSLDAMIKGASELASTVTRERERDDAEGVLDEASYEASAASRFHAIMRSDRVDGGIESAVVDYMRQLTEGHGVRKLDTQFGSGAVLRFQPEKTCYGALPVDEDGTEFLGGNYDGTFRREVAQRAPRLHFFNVGDPLFNAVIASLDRHGTGRVFAVELSAPNRAPWIGLECRFTPTLDPARISDSSGLRNRRDALFIPRPLGVFIDLQGVISADADSLVLLRRRLEKSNRGQTWWDLSTLGPQLTRALDQDSWPNAVEHLIGLAQVEAVRLLNEQLGAAISAEQARVAAIVDLLIDAGERGDEEAVHQARDYAAFAAALPHWRATLDAVGILSVNGQLRSGRLA
jgi:ATP-dependent helicase HepA